jgi:hypothetical protein
MGRLDSNQGPTDYEANHGVECVVVESSSARSSSDSAVSACPSWASDGVAPVCTLLAPFGTLNGSPMSPSSR